MAVKKNNPPSSNVLINSIRSIGYSFKTALADIVDNSVSAKAKNIYIFAPFDEENVYISILDDGFGMNKEELFNAMKYGTEREGYGKDELGRFGLGLKSASSSQCKMFTVASKKENSVNAYKWDLDIVTETNNWDCLELNEKEINRLPQIDKLKKMKSGTLVVWENFDVAFKKSNGRVREYLTDEIDEAENHLSLVFHRFLNRKFKPLHIYINNSELKGLDPFLENHHKTDAKKPSEIPFEGSKIMVTPYILPHQSDLSNEDIEKLGGEDSLRGKQGFYIYRNERLIISGTWFKLNPSNMSSELYKYGRIKVDIPNTLDDIWEIDIKKQSAVIPRQIIQYLKKSVISVCEKSKNKNAYRVKLDYKPDVSRIWNKGASRNGKDYYYINIDSEFIKHFLNELDDETKQKTVQFLDAISSSLPYDDIYYSICNRSNETELSDNVIDSIVNAGLLEIKNYKKLLKCSNDTAYEKTVKYEPFNDPKISQLLKERM